MLLSKQSIRNYATPSQSRLFSFFIPNYVCHGHMRCNQIIHALLHRNTVTIDENGLYSIIIDTNLLLSIVVKPDSISHPHNGYQFIRYREVHSDIICLFFWIRYF
jgi:hypothetical protein